MPTRALGTEDKPAAERTVERPRRATGLVVVCTCGVGWSRKGGAATSKNATHGLRKLLFHAKTYLLLLLQQAKLAAGAGQRRLKCLGGRYKQETTSGSHRRRHGAHPFSSLLLWSEWGVMDK